MENLLVKMGCLKMNKYKFCFYLKYVHSRDGRYSLKITSQYFKNICASDIYDNIEKKRLLHLFSITFISPKCLLTHCVFTKGLDFNL